jgi:hypothetical protein
MMLELLMLELIRMLVRVALMRLLASLLVLRLVLRRLLMLVRVLAVLVVPFGLRRELLLEVLLVEGIGHRLLARLAWLWEAHWEWMLELTIWSNSS